MDGMSEREQSPILACRARRSGRLVKPGGWWFMAMCRSMQRRQMCAETPVFRLRWQERDVRVLSTPNRSISTATSEGAMAVDRSPGCASRPMNSVKRLAPNSASGTATRAIDHNPLPTLKTTSAAAMGRPACNLGHDERGGCHQRPDRRMPTAGCHLDHPGANLRKANQRYKRHRCRKL